jgi:hypothetical protein
MNKQLENMSPTQLKNYIERGNIVVMLPKPIPTRIEDTPEFKKHKRLAGKPIHLSEACRKYGIALSTLSQWVKRGLIKKMPRDKNKIMLDEAYVAYAVDVRNSHTNSKRKWLFNTDGTPYVRKTPPR